MIELTKHIEILLLENDCVIVPELGGFIAHYQSACYEEAEGVFLPPVRTIGFNPQLTMNDGLLTQSYMQAYHTDFPDASRKIAKTVNKIKNTLYSEGVVNMQGIGDLYYTIHKTYEFHPAPNGILSPALYALESFSISPLAAKTEEKPFIPATESQPFEWEDTPKTKRLVPHWLSNTVAIAVAVILFFILSVPVENTYIDKGNYASLGTDCLFDAIRSQSMATALTASEPSEEPQKKKEVAPIAVKVEKVASAVENKTIAETETPAPEVKKPEVVKKETTTPKAETATKAETAKKQEKKVAATKRAKYHIIVSSLTSASDAQQFIKKYKQQGYNEVSVIEGNGRFRISLYSFAERSSAQEKLNELKKMNSFKEAWMFTSK